MSSTLTEDVSRPPIVIAGVPYRTEAGKTHNRFSGMYNTGENVPELMDIQAYYTYRKMRRSDPTVSAVMRSIELPIRQATFDVSPPVDKPTVAEKDQAKYISDWLLDRLDWGKSIRQAITSLTHGFAVLEKVYERSRGKIVPRKLAFRPQNTLIDDKRDSNGELTALIQDIDGRRIELERERLILFTVGGESGSDWRGQSLLRSAYKPWYIKERMEIITGIAHERFTAGIPYVIAPDGAVEGDENWKSAERALENLHAGTHSRVVIPFGWVFSILERKSQPMDPIAFIKELKDDIKTAPLALHLRLGGNDTSGSKALGVTFVDSFLHGVQAWGNLIVESFNEDLIKDLVHQNWGFREGMRYPKMAITNIYKSELKVLAYLVQVGIIEPTEELVKYILEQYGIRIDPDNIKPGKGSGNNNSNNDSNSNSDSNNNNKNGNNDNNAGGNDGD